MDRQRLPTVSRLPPVPVLRRLFRQFFRRHALCDEGRLHSHRAMHAAALLPKLVPAALSIRLRGIPLRTQLTFIPRSPPMRTNVVVASAVSDFAADVRSGLTRDGQKELPSKYLYDSLGSR